MYLFTHGLHRGMLKFHNNENEWIHKNIHKFTVRWFHSSSEAFNWKFIAVDNIEIKVVRSIVIFSFVCFHCCCMYVSVWKCMQIFLDFPFNWMTIRVIPWKIQNNFHVSLWWVVRSVRHATVEMEIYHVIISVSKSNHSKLNMVIFYLCNKSKIVRHFVSKTYESSKSWVHILFIYDWIITMADRQCYSVK